MPVSSAFYCCCCCRQRKAKKMVMLDEQEYVYKSTFATLPKTARATSLVLGASPDSKRFVYCNGNSVVMRDVENPSISELYTEHSHPTTVAKYAPSGYYIASGDSAGKVRVWDTTQSTHILKNEYGIINGPIKDIAWSPDSKRLAVVGEGREKFGHVFLFDTGTSNGSLSGQSKTMNSIDFRPERPYRLVSASEDNTVAMFEGPPFKFKTLFHQHSRFAQCVRYQPVTGALFASCGADGRMILFEGAEGEVKGEFVDSALKGSVAHAGGIYSLSWAPDGRHILTASGDKTCKWWDVETRQCVVSWNMGSTVEEQQLGCLCIGPHQLSVSLSGSISYLDASNPSAPIRTINGHNKPISSMAVNRDTHHVFTADSEGNMCRWNSETGSALRVRPQLHKANVSGVDVKPDGSLTTASWDDTIARTTQVLQPSVAGLQPTNLSLQSQPRGLAVSPDGQLTLAACQKEVLIFRGGSINSGATRVPIDYEASSIDLHPSKLLFAVGSASVSSADNVVRVYRIGEDVGASGCAIVKELNHQGPISCVKFSHSGNHLVACDQARRVVPYDVQQDFKVASAKDWAFHSAKVACCAWHPSDRFIATGGLDTNVIVWDMLRSGEHPIIIKGAHHQSQINAIGWLDDTTVLSAGHDSNLKQWTIKLPQ